MCRVICPPSLPMSMQRHRYLAAPLLAVALAASGMVTALADDEPHPVVMQEAAQQVATAPVTNLPTGASSLASPARASVSSSALKREVFGFALASSLSDSTVGYPSWDFSLLSTVAFFGLHVNDNGTIASDSGWTVWNSSQLTNLVTAAHNAGSKVVVTLI